MIKSPQHTFYKNKNEIACFCSDFGDHIRPTPEDLRGQTKIHSDTNEGPISFFPSFLVKRRSGEFEQAASKGFIENFCFFNCFILTV